jgi:hypothetical protein
VHQVGHYPEGKMIFFKFNIFFFELVFLILGTDESLHAFLNLAVDGAEWLVSRSCRTGLDKGGGGSS